MQEIPVNRYKYLTRYKLYNSDTLVLQLSLWQDLTGDLMLDSASHYFEFQNFVVQRQISLVRTE